MKHFQLVLRTYMKNDARIIQSIQIPRPQGRAPVVKPPPVGLLVQVPFTMKNDQHPNTEGVQSILGMKIQLEKSPWGDVTAV